MFDLPLDNRQEIVATFLACIPADGCLWKTLSQLEQDNADCSRKAKKKTRVDRIGIVYNVYL
ncbi:MAG: hypothetical protein GY820_31960 [Gammaproteobacteria bacterium]|nr:hypothetical protein [Gammaproteobacteria bacterium]